MMPEEAPAVQNWRLLIVACVLGLVVMVVYNVHINKIKRGLDKVMVTAFRYDRNMEVGDKITDEDLVRYELTKDTAESIGRLLEENEKDTLAINQAINRDVSKGDFAMTGHFTTLPNSGIASELHEDKVHITILIDSKKSVGKVLRIGNYVNVLGMLPTKQGTYQTYRIIEKLKVVAIAGQTGSAGGKRSAESGSRSFSTITVEMKRKDPDVSLQWNNLLTHLHGSAFIEICSSKHKPKKGEAGTIAEELIAPFTAKAAVTAAGGFGDGNY